MISVRFEYLNDNDEWETVSHVCETMEEAQFKKKSIENRFGFKYLGIWVNGYRIVEITALQKKEQYNLSRKVGV